MRANILYVSRKELEKSRFAKRFMSICKKNGNVNGSVRLTKCEFGLSTLANKRKQGFNTALLDFECLEEIGSAKRVLERFTKNDPLMPIFILCKNYEDSLRATDLFVGCCLNLNYFSRNDVSIVYRFLRHHLG